MLSQAAAACTATQRIHGPPKMPCQCAAILFLKTACSCRSKGSWAMPKKLQGSPQDVTAQTCSEQHIVIYPDKLTLQQRPCVPQNHPEDAPASVLAYIWRAAEHAARQFRSIQRSFCMHATAVVVLEAQLMPARRRSGLLLHAQRRKGTSSVSDPPTGDVPKGFLGPEASTEGPCTRWRMCRCAEGDTLLEA